MTNRPADPSWAVPLPRSRSAQKSTFHSSSLGLFFFEHTEVKYKKTRPSLRLEGRQHGSALLLHPGFTSPMGTLWHVDELPTDSEERLGLLVETNCINK